MAKVVNSAAKIVGTVASVVALVPGPWQAPARAIAAVASVVTAVTAKKPRQSVAGSPTEVRTDVQAPIPYMVGRTYNAGNVVHHADWGKDGKYYGRVHVWSLGPIDGIEAFQADRATVGFNGTAASGFYAGFMHLATQLGALPEAAALAVPNGPMPGWGASSKLSGYAAGALVLTFDTKGKKFSGGVPQTGIVGRGVKVYDPRLDSTYPGGAGTCRARDEATYVYSENPWLHALTFALGRYHNGQRVLGVGMPIAGIDVPAFVEAANVADANGWKAGGIVYSTDDKWNVLKGLAQAGGGEPIRLGAKLSCMVDTPRVSLATIRSADLIGEGSVVGTRPRRERINSIIPRVRLETHGWEIVPLDVVRVGTYVTEDGDTRTREAEYPFIQSKTHGAQRAAYDVANAREFGPITLPLKTIWMGYKPGDCLTHNIPELGLNGQKAILINRGFEPATGQVTHDFRSETEAKHAFALGQVGTAPPTPSLTSPDLSTVPAPETGAWVLSGTSLASPSGSIPALVITGTVDNGNAEAVVVELKVNGEPDTAFRIAAMGPPETVKLTISQGLTPGTEYVVAISYIVRAVTSARRSLGVATVGSMTAAIAGPEAEKLAGIANGATKNRSFRQTSDPAANAANAVVDGDDWTDTSSAPMIRYIRIGGTWQTSANYVTDTKHVTDGANLGGTATWSGVGSKPTNISTLTGTEKILNGDISVAAGKLIGIGTADIFVDNSVITGEFIDDAGKVAVRLNRGGAGVATQQFGLPVQVDATKSRIFRQATPPANPTVNDQWVDTSVTPNVTKVWDGLAWQPAANLISSADHVPESATKKWAAESGADVTSGKALSVLSGRTADQISYTGIGAPTVDAMKPAEAGAEKTAGKSITVLTDRVASNMQFGSGETVEALKPAEAGAEKTAGKSLSVLTDRTLDLVAETAARKHFAATEKAKLGGISEGATKTFPPSATAPTGAVEGDEWPDTSAGSVVLRRLTGGAWQAVSSFGSDWGGPVAARYWRINATCPTRNFWVMVELKLEKSAGSGNLAAGKTATQSSFLVVDTEGKRFGEAQRLLDTDPLTGFHSDHAPSHWVQVDFGTAVSIGSLTMKARNADVGDEPRTMSVVYSNDGATWQTAYENNAIPDWGPDEVRTFSWPLPQSGSNITGKPVSVHDINSAEGDKLTSVDFGADVTLDQPVVSKLDPNTGRLRESLSLHTSAMVGVKGTTAARVTSSDAGNGTATISIDPHPRGVPGVSGEILRNYNSGIIPGMAFSTYYLIFADDPNFVGGAVAYQATTNSADLNRAGRVWVGFITTVASGGGSNVGDDTGTYNGGSGWQILP